MLSATPMSPAVFYEAFLAVIAGIRLCARRRQYQDRTPDARQLPSIDLPEQRERRLNEIVTQIITMKNISAALLRLVLRPLIPQQGHLAAYSSGNMLIISDRASNVSRTHENHRACFGCRRRGTSRRDSAAINASATELARTVNQLNQGGAPRVANRSRSSPIAPSNCVLISGEEVTATAG